MNNRFDENKLKLALKKQIKKLNLKDPFYPLYFEHIYDHQFLKLIKSPEVKDKFLISDIPKHKHPKFDSLYVKPYKYTIKVTHKILNKKNLINKEYELISLNLINSLIKLIVEITLNLFPDRFFKNFIHPAHHNAKHVNFETIELKKHKFSNFFLKQRQIKNNDRGLLFINPKDNDSEILSLTNTPFTKVFTSNLNKQILFVNDWVIDNELISYQLNDDNINIYFTFEYNFGFAKNYMTNELYEFK